MCRRSPEHSLMTRMNPFQYCIRFEIHSADWQLTRRCFKIARQMSANPFRPAGVSRFRGGRMISNAHRTLWTSWRTIWETCAEWLLEGFFLFRGWARRRDGILSQGFCRCLSSATLANARIEADAFFLATWPAKPIVPWRYEVFSDLAGTWPLDSAGRKTLDRRWARRSHHSHRSTENSVKLGGTSWRTMASPTEPSVWLEATAIGLTRRSI